MLTQKIFIRLIFRCATCIGIVAPLNICSAQINFTFPIGSVRFLAGTDTIITWNHSSPTDTFQLSFSADSGYTWQTISDSAVGEACVWHVPSIATDRCVLRLRLVRNAARTTWEKRIGSGGDDAAWGVVAGDSGDVFTTGAIADECLFGDSLYPTHGGSDIFLLKYNSAGVLDTVATYGFSNATYYPGFAHYAYNIARDKLGKVFIVGWFQMDAKFDNYRVVSNGGMDMFLAKVNAHGEVSWATSAGGVGDEIAYAVAVDSIGNVAVAGSFQDTMMMGPDSLQSAGATDAFVAQFTTNGYINWARRIGGRLNDMANAVAVDRAGNIVVTGFFHDTANLGATTLITRDTAWECFIAKYNRSGTLLWAHNVGKANYMPDVIRSNALAIDTAGNIFVCGMFQDTAFFDSTTLVSTGSEDAFLMKMDSGGGVVWIKHLGGRAVACARAITLDNNGNIYIAGIFEGNIIFANTNVESVGGYDIFLAKYSRAGVLQWFDHAGNYGDDYADAVAVDNRGAVYVTGCVNDPLDFNGTSTQNISGYDAYIWRRDTLSAALAFTDSLSSIIIQPIKILFPDSGAVLNGGMDANVSWSGLPLTDTLALEWSSDSEKTWNIISDSAAGDVYQWRVADTLRTNCFMRATDETIGFAGGWSKSFGNQARANCVATDSAGNVFIAGIFGDLLDANGMVFRPVGGTDAYLAKYSQDGRLQWFKPISGPSWPDQARALAIDRDGDVYVAGVVYTTATFGDTLQLLCQGATAFIAKFSTMGQALWANPLWGGGYDGGAGGRALAIDSAGFIYVAGDDGSNMYIAKYSPDGNQVWQRSSSPNGNYSVGEADCLAIDHHNNIFVSGVFVGSLLFGNAPLAPLTHGRELFLAKFNDSGTIAWAQRIGSANDDYVYAMTLDENGGVYINGEFEDSTVVNDSIVFRHSVSSGICKFDSSGAYRWFQWVPYSSSNWSGGMACDSRRHVWIAGWGYIAEYDTAGNFIHMFSENAEFFGASTDRFHQLYFCGEFEGTQSFGNTNLIARGEDMLLWKAAQPPPASAPSGPWKIISATSVKPAVINNIPESPRMTVQPTPAMNAATVQLTMPERDVISLSLVNIYGEIVSSLYHGIVETGSREFSLPVATLSTGTYFVSLQTTTSKKMSPLQIVH